MRVFLLVDGDHYAAYADLQNILQNSGLTTAGDTLFNENGAEIALDLTQAIINKYIGATTITSITDTLNATLCKHVQLNMVSMMILRSRQFKENNIDGMSEMISYWQVTPALTFADKELLNLVKQDQEGVAWTFDLRSGQEVSLL